MQRTIDEQRVEMVIHLFHGYFREAANITVDELRTTIPSFFMNWLYQNVAMLPREQLCQDTDTSMEVWEWFDKLADGQVPVEALIGIWPAVTLSRMPKPEKEIASATLLFLLKYTDGQIFPMQIHAVPDLITQKDVLPENDLAYFLHSRVAPILDQLRTDGIDGLYKLGDNFGTQHDFEVFMGVLIHLLPKHLKPEYQAIATKYSRLFQSILQPPLPPEMKRMIEKRKAERQGVSVGGFDLG